MGDVIEFSSRSPHLSGDAKCIECHHEWVAVAPVGTTSLECPKCGTHKGAFYGVCMPEDEIYICDCGNDLYFKTRQGNKCARCGLFTED